MAKPQGMGGGVSIGELNQVRRGPSPLLWGSGDGQGFCSSLLHFSSPRPRCSGSGERSARGTALLPLPSHLLLLLPKKPSR